MTDYPADSHRFRDRDAAHSTAEMDRQHRRTCRNAKRAAKDINPVTADRSPRLNVEIAEWKKKLIDWKDQAMGPRLSAELRILKAMLDASMDEANAAASELQLFA